MLDVKPWTLPLIAAAIVGPVVAGFVVGGPLLGLVLGLAVAGVIVVIAARQRPGGPIEAAAAEEGRRHVLVVVSHELDDPGAVEQLKRSAHLTNGDEDTEVRILAPAKTKLLDKWATDLGPARGESSGWAARRRRCRRFAACPAAGIATTSTIPRRIPTPATTRFTTGRCPDGRLGEISAAPPNR